MASGIPPKKKGEKAPETGAEPVYRMSMLPFGTYANPDGTESLGFAVPGMIKEPFDALQRLAANSVDENGNIAIPNPENSQNQQDVLTGILSMYGGNALNPAAALPKNAVGMFAGRMAKTADHTALARAEELAAQGAPREQIWNETGWLQGPDQKWRFEVDDSAAPVNLTPNFNGTRVRANSVGMALDHPSLFAAYPELASMTLTQSGAPRSGSFMEDLKRIDVGPYSPTSDRSVLLHEIQHAIQGNEGFARGANSGDFTYQNSPLFSERRSYESPADAYKRVAGEVESRNVEKRANMAPEERRATPPWLTQDVPDSNQIVRFFSDTGKPSLMGSAIAGAEAPQRMYHGTTADFSTFKPSESGSFGPGVYFSSSPEYASQFAFEQNGSRVFPVDVQGPLASMEDYFSLLHANGRNQAKTLKMLEDQGYTGIITSGERPSQNVTSVFKPGSVRSATTGETLFSDTGLPSLPGSLAAGQDTSNSNTNGDGMMIAPPQVGMLSGVPGTTLANPAPNAPQMALPAGLLTGMDMSGAAPQTPPAATPAAAPANPIMAGLVQGDKDAIAAMPKMADFQFAVPQRAPVDLSRLAAIAQARGLGSRA